MLKRSACGAAAQTVQTVFEALKAVPYKVSCIHGECAQQQREAAIEAFRCGKSQLLVATDVAARGLHIRNLPYICNFDFPSNLETYIHRAGRTGAAAAHQMLPFSSLVSNIWQACLTCW